VQAIIQQQFTEWSRNGTRDAAFVEAALLVEAGFHKTLDGLVVTWCRPEQQLERLRSRGFSDEDARRRIAAQLPIAEKLSYATEKIDTSSSLEETRRQVTALAARLRRKNTRVPR
jgi:dephospho-CoA kinase